MASLETAVPPEIWIQIALYLSKTELRQLATLNRTFAALAKDYTLQLQRTLVLDMNPQYYKRRPWDADETTWKLVAVHLAKRLHNRAKDGLIENVKTVIFHSHFAFTSGEVQRLSAFEKLKRAFSGLANELLFLNRLPSLYKRLTSVESLILIYESEYNWGGSRCFGFMSPTALWSAFASNLRELSISVDDALLQFLPSNSAQIYLPRLEVMRFAYNKEWESFRDTPGLVALAALYLPATETLRTLQIRFHHYASHEPPLAPTLLPQTAVFQQLCQFMIIVDRFEDSAVNDPVPVDLISSFIDRHLTKLDTLVVHGIPSLNKRLAETSNALNLADVGGEGCKLRISLACDAGDITLQPHAQELSVINLRSCVFSLSLTHVQVEFITAYVATSLPNLRRLDLRNCNLFSPRKLAELARSLPGLVSLSAMFNKGQQILLLAFQEFSPNEDTKSALKQWNLKDLTILGIHQRSFEPCLALMQHIVSLVPSIVSFGGHGHMNQVEEPPWANSWGWKTRHHDLGG